MVDYSTSDGICLLGGLDNHCNDDCNECDLAKEYQAERQKQNNEE